MTTNGDKPDVRIHVATINTAAVTELCIRTMHRTAGYPFDLVVGDGGSTDGSLDMLRTFEQRGWLTLEIAPGGRSHTAWLDKWYPECPNRFAVFSDSDVEYHHHGWLREMVDAANRTGAALVATRIQARGGVAYKHPRTGAERQLAERPEPWLMMLDLDQVRDVVDTSFAYRDELAPDGSKIAFDTSAVFFRDMKSAGLTYVEMPPEFAKAYTHYGSMSWKKLRDQSMPLKLRAKQLAKLTRIKVSLLRARFQTRAAGT